MVRWGPSDPDYARRPVVLGIFFAVLFILLNGFFVAAEFAFVKVSTTLAGTKKAPREDPRIDRCAEDRLAHRSLSLRHAARHHAREPRSRLDR